MSRKSVVSWLVCGALLALSAPAEARLTCPRLFSKTNFAETSKRVPRIAVISGTNRDGSNTLKVSTQVAERLRALGADVILVDIADVPTSTYSGRNYFSAPQTFQKNYAAKLDQADALVFVFPEYDGTYPGILGTFLNYVRVPFNGKPIGMVAISAGQLGGQKGAEHLSSTFRHRKADIVGEAQVNVPHLDAAMSNGRISDSGLLQRIDNAGRSIVDRVRRLFAEEQRVNEFLDVAIQSKTPLSFTLNSSVEVRGQLVEVLRDASGSPFFVKWTGPTQLRENGVVIPGQDTNHHPSGFSMPMGKIKTPAGVKSLSAIKSQEELAALGIQIGVESRIEFESGVVVIGTLKAATFSADGHLQLLSFSTAKATYGRRVLYDPSWGTYDIAVAERIVSMTP